MVISPTLLSFISGVSCPPAVRLEFDNAEKKSCEELRGKPEENPWRQIKCRRFKTHYSRQIKNCSSWCNLFASCFNETSRWTWQCTAMFRLSCPFQISAARDSASLHVHPCRKNGYAVKVSRCNCSEDDNETGK